MKIINLENKLYDYLKYFYSYIPYRKIVKEWNYKIYTAKDTVEFIIKHQISVSRYGDGEFGIMNNKSSSFQNNDKKLAERLKEIIQCPIPHHIVCIPYALKNNQYMTISARAYWQIFALSNHKVMESNVSNDREYFDASFTRFYIDLRDKSQVPEMVTLIKQIWKDRDVYLVEGYSSRLGVGNNLFMGANSVKRILCPSQNAFSKYNEIIFKIEHLVPHNALILIALGMTATVLAYDLSKLGYQAIDIGHIDVEYCWFKMQAKYKCTIPGKAVNEVGVPNNYSKCNDKDYKESILLHIV